MQTTSDILLFFGRFHPLFVHLPIGLLSFALLLEVLMLWKPRERFKQIIPMVWMLSALGAGLSASSGYLLSLGGGYEEESLNLHKQMGITLFIISTLCFLLYVVPLTFMKKAVQPLRTILVLGAGVLLVITGHGGGSLTHGSNYLTEFSPLRSSDQASEENSDQSSEESFVRFSVGSSDGRPLTANASGMARSTKVTSLDSADVFIHAVMPILQSKCVSCHNAEKKKGGLLLTSYEAILAGGKTKEGLVSGNTANSEIFRRITLPKDHKEFMPTDGKTPLTENQVAILEWWIETGAHRNMAVAALHPNKKMQDVLEDFFQIGQAAILAYTAKQPDRNDLVSLLNAGFQVNRINKSSNLLEVKFIGREKQKPDLSLLNKVKEQLVWLQLVNCGVTDEDLKTIGRLTHLYKLNLNRNEITDKGVENLSGLSKLEHLNLYGTSITEKSIPLLSDLPALQKLYVWETRIDTTLVENTPKSKKDLNIVYRYP